MSRNWFEGVLEEEEESLSDTVSERVCSLVNLHPVLHVDVCIQIGEIVIDSSPGKYQYIARIMPFFSKNT